jgi:DNA processing protein
MSLQTLKFNPISKCISPFREIVAYETLWNDHNASFKKISELFKQHPGCMPSELVDYHKMNDLQEKIKAHLLKNVPYKTNILINGTFDYPQKLKDAKDPVEMLYYSGNLDYLSTKSVAIVGTRKASPDGVKRAAKLTRLLVEDGYTIVSGLADGIDTVAHKTAIENKGKTIAVIGTPINEYYPKTNSDLQNHIAKEHLLISQVPLHRYSEQTPFWNKLFFPERNKTMSALTAATIIIEASDTSGTLIQAKAAIDQKRKLFILDNCFLNSSLKWPERFLKLGAIRVKEYEDIKANL